MKRKTNLFYGDETDTKLIMFSNYTDSLTGNFLSTDTKLFPSRFLCVSLPGLTEYDASMDDRDREAVYIVRKAALIRYMAAYYENKLAALRDFWMDRNVKPEDRMLPLNYLLEALYRIAGFTDAGEPALIPLGQTNTAAFTIPYMGDITEQDWNGTYTDTICTVDLAKYSMAEPVFDMAAYAMAKDGDMPDFTDAESASLYGWYGCAMPASYKDVTPVYDEIPETDGAASYVDSYRTLSGVTGLKTGRSQASSVSFNLLIPLFDVTDMNPDTSLTVTVDAEETVDLTQGGSVKPYNRDVPMGMWFSGRTPMELYKDPQTGYSPAWSLLIGSQFKPFPYTGDMPSEVSTNSALGAYPTFAAALAEQTKLSDRFTELTYSLSALSDRVSRLESSMKSVGTAYSLDLLQKEIIDFEGRSRTEAETFRKQVLSYMSGLKWNLVK